MSLGKDLRMITTKRLAIFLILVVIVHGYGRKAYALGECGLSCCVAGALSSGATLAPNFGLTLQYENTYMKTLRKGTDRISPDTILDNEAAGWPGMPAETREFSVPAEMRMQKWTILGAYPATERLQFLAIIPFVINDMDMRMIMRTPMGLTTKMPHSMDTVDGLGDITLIGLYMAYTDAPIRPAKRFTLGLGIKTPTGENNEKASSGNLVHAMMQPGTGSWDPIVIVNYMRGFYPLVLQTNFLYQLTTEGDEGYEFGDQVTLDLIARYQVANYVNMGLEMNGLYAAKDKDYDGKYSRPDAALVDNITNTGIKSVYMSPSLQFKIPEKPASIDVKYQLPVYQDANGIQQVIDRRLLLSIAFAF